MSPGSIVIANDLLGTLISTEDGLCKIVDVLGNTYNIQSSVVNEVCNPHALAFLLFDRIVSRQGG